MQTLILGGARSGKSRYAEQRAKDSGKEVIYIATAQAHDGEMMARIKQHQNNRPINWRTVEEPEKLAVVLAKNATDHTCILVDCLTLWLSNILIDRQGFIQEQFFVEQTEALYETLVDLPGQLLLVSNEVGMGIIPLGAGTRRYVDEAGRLHQRLAQQCQQVVMVTAGLPQILK